ncbi:MAG: thioredoxin family protein [Nannocystaceae bacterium]|nr:thioredoxin family protein [Nannocystaceae bacterium]
MTATMINLMINPSIATMPLVAGAIDVMPDLSQGGIVPYAAAFLAGVAVDLTPCVFPLIPITVSVFGAKGVSRGRALYLASAYVLGMATLYTTLGVVVAMTGAAFGAWLANPWVVLPITAVLLALAASMFGAFDLQLPTSIQNKLNTVGGAGPIGAFLMGLVSGFISAPCSGPVLVSILTYIAASTADGGSVAYGGSLLFVYALGMGTLFFAVALGASLFRPGRWMENVKSVFGVLLLVMSLWFLRPLSSQLENFILNPSWGMWVGITLVLVGVGSGAVHLSFHAAGAERLRKGVAVAVTTFGAIVAVNNFVYAPPADWHKVKDAAGLASELANGDESGKLVMVDFAASWCLPCKEMDLLTFGDERVAPRLGRDFYLIKVDVTEGSDEQTTMQEAFGAQSLPSVVIYRAGADLSAHASKPGRGETMPEPAVRFRTFVNADEFLGKIDAL